MPNEIHQSDKLADVLYDIRGPVLDEAKRLEAAGQRIIKLNIGNPHPFGFETPAEILVEVSRSLQVSQGYSDSQGITAARTAIVQHYQNQGIDITNIDDVWLGNGVSELIQLSLNALLNEGDEVLIPAPDYPLWTASTTLAGGSPVHYLCDEQNEWNPDIADIESKITSRTKAIVVINPNNPTGTWLDAHVLRAFLARVPEHVIVVIDEAYAELADAPEYRSGLAMRDAHPNLVVSRTFSKAYGLAGMRVGYFVAPAGLVAVMERVRESFNVNLPALAACEAALGDVEHLEWVRARNREERAALSAALQARGLRVFPSQTNFLLVEFGERTAAVEHALVQRGVVLRPMGGYGLGDCLRITVGTRDENRRLLLALDEVLA